jgi:hypothetical protein
LPFSRNLILQLVAQPRADFCHEQPGGAMQSACGQPIQMMDDLVETRP